MQNATTDSHSARSFDLFTTIRGILSDAVQRAGFKSVRRVRRTASQRIQTLEERVVLSIQSLGMVGPVTAGVQTPRSFPQVESRVHSTLLAWAAREAGDQTAVVSETASLFLENSEGQVGIRATASDVNLVTSQLVGFGFEPTSALPEQHIVEGFITASALSQVSQAQITGLLGIIPIYRPQTSVGSLTSEATYTIVSITHCQLVTTVAA